MIGLRAFARLRPALLLALGVAAFVAVRVHVYADDVPNPDIAGILYNADVIVDGDLPYRDTAEMKPPGAFLLVALSFATFGRGLLELQWFHAVWLLLGAPAIWIAATTRHPSRDAAAIATVVYLFYVGQFTYNYSAWMATPYAWAFAALVRSLATGRASWAVLAGASAAAAVLTIQRAAVLGPVALALWFLARRRGEPGARVATLGGWIGGAALGVLPLLVWFAAHGEVLTLVRAIVPFATAGDYASTAHARDGWTLVPAVVDQLFAVFGLACLLVGAAALARFDACRRGTCASTPPIEAWLFLAASIGGAGLGGARFYVHYLPQYVAALALMAGDPELVAAFRHALHRGGTRRAIAVLATFLAMVAGTWAIVDIARGRCDRYEGRPRRNRDGHTAAQVAGDHIRTRTQPDDRIFVWGWPAWPTYYWADRRAPGRVYKQLGTLTTFNSNTAFALSRPLHFRPGPIAAAFIADFDASPPAFVVVAAPSFAPGKDPLLEFTALEQRLQRDYRVDARFDDLVVLRRAKER